MPLPNTSLKHRPRHLAGSLLTSQSALLSHTGKEARILVKLQPACNKDIIFRTGSPGKVVFYQGQARCSNCKLSKPGAGNFLAPPVQVRVQMATERRRHSPPQESQSSSAKIAASRYSHPLFPARRGQQRQSIHHQVRIKAATQVQHLLYSKAITTAEDQGEFLSLPGHCQGYRSSL